VLDDKGYDTSARVITVFRSAPGQLAASFSDPSFCAVDALNFCLARATLASGSP